MPESYPSTQTPCVVQNRKKVRSEGIPIGLSLLEKDFLDLPTLAESLNLTKPQVLSILQRMEENGEVFCRNKLWQLTDSRCDMNQVISGKIKGKNHATS